MPGVCAGDRRGRHRTAALVDEPREGRVTAGPHRIGSVRGPAGARLAVVPIRRRELPVLGVDARVDHGLEQLIDGELLQLGERSPTPADLLVESGRFRIERGLFFAVRAHATSVGLKTPKTQAGESSDAG